MKTHKLKTLPQHFHAVIGGYKLAELRENDRDFQVGDILKLQEWSPEHGYYGNTVTKRIIHVADVGAYLSGFVLLSMGDIDGL
ncbi:MAG: DUF3850 domain-containing protein [Shewanella sp.]|uniref:DUF3850 domain-containing protein n=1 Tax=Aeromonas popoffii TaxID=70856 RepID=UPI003F2DBEBE